MTANNIVNGGPRIPMTRNIYVGAYLDVKIKDR